MAALGQTPMEMLRTAWIWWRDEMASMTPPAISKALSRWTRTLLIDCDGASLHLSCTGRSSAADPVSIPRPDVTTESDAAALGSLVSAWPDTYDRIVLRLSPDRALRRRLRLPLAARDTLHEAVALDLDRQMPLPADALYFGVREVALHRAEGEIEAQLDAVQRSDADPVLDLLSAAGLPPDRLDVDPDGPNLLTAGTFGGATRRRRRITVILGGVAAVLTLLAIWLPAQRIEDSLANIRAESAEIRAEATRVATLRERIAAIEARRKTLITRKQASPLTLDVIAAATEAINDDAFLLELTLDGDRLTMNGYARTASEVLSAIDSSPMFSDSRFISSVTQDAQLQRDRFTLSARIVGEATAAAPADDGAGS